VATFSPTRLRARREALGLSREHVAIRVTRTAQTIRLWEIGAVAPWPSTLNVLAQQLNCNVADLCEPTTRRRSSR
jgi:transcriptional regulator with XRE-family HTH domain